MPSRPQAQVRLGRFLAHYGIRIELYAALIASLLIVLWTGRKPTKRTLEMLQFHFQGWASASEVDAHIAGLTLAQ